MQHICMHTHAPWSHPAYSSRLVLDDIWPSPKIKFTFREERFFFIKFTSRGCVVSSEHSSHKGDQNIFDK